MDNQEAIQGENLDQLTPYGQWLQQVKPKLPWNKHHDDSKRKKPYFKIGRNEYSKEETIWGWIFVLPCVILSGIFTLGPIVISIFYAFTDAQFYNMSAAQWVGFQNFEKAFNDPNLGPALTNTLLFVVEVVPLQLFISLGLALLLTKITHGNTFLRWAFFVPVMLSLAVTSMLWMNLLNESDGLINALIVALGGLRVDWMTNDTLTMQMIIFISAWQGAGYQMMIFLSALKNVDGSLYEASEIDGANAWNRFIHVTLPAIKPTFSFVLITMLIAAFRIITQPMIMTGGDYNTMTMSYYIYKQGITYFDVGYSSAIALLFTILMAAVSLTLRRLLEGKKD